MSLLQQLTEVTVVVADTGDIRSIEEFKPRDATTNPSLITAAAQMPEYADVVDEALNWAQKAQGHPNTAIWAHLPEVSALGLLGRIEEARAALERLQRLKPDVSVAFVGQTLTFTRAADREHFVSGLIKAGMPG